MGDLGKGKVDVAVIGCGPAGLFVAVELAKRGKTCTVFEKRTAIEVKESRVDDTTFGITGRSYAIALRERGFQVLKAIHSKLYDNVVQTSVREPGTIMWTNGEKRPLGSDGENIFTTRDTVVNALLDLIKVEYAEYVTLVFGCRVRAVKLKPEQNILEFDGPDVHHVVEAQVVVGADGVNSVVRRCLENEGITQVTSFDDPSPYKVTMLQPIPTLGSDMHVFVQRGLANVIITPFADGSLSMMVLPNPHNKDVGFSVSHFDTDGISSMKAIKDFEDSFRKNFPGLSSLISKDNAQVFESVLNSPAFVGRTIKCDKYNGGTVVLVGDSAHSTLPTTGQGLTAAMLSALQLFEKHSWDGDSSTAEVAFKEYSKDLAEDRVALFEAGKWVASNRWGVRYIFFMLSMRPLRYLSRKYPQRFAPGLYDMFNNSKYTYIEAWNIMVDRIRVTEIVVKALLTVLTLGLVLVFGPIRLLLATLCLLPGFYSPYFFFSEGKHLSLLVLMAYCFNSLAQMSDLGQWQIIYGVVLAVYTLRLLTFSVWRDHQPSFAREQKERTSKMDDFSTTTRCTMLVSLAFLYNIYITPVVSTNAKSPYLAIPGLFLMGVGGYWEAIADYTKSKFKAKHPKTLCKEGLFQLSRHPNYAGEILFWTGLSMGLLPYKEWYIGLMAWLLKSATMYMAALRLDGTHKLKYAGDPENKKYFAKVPMLFPRLNFPA